MPKQPLPLSIVFISLENWDEIWRRNQFLCSEYARRHRDACILFVTPPRDLTNAIRRRDWARLKPRKLWSPTSLPNIKVFQPTKLMPNSLVIGRSLNIALMRRQIQGKMQKLGVLSPLLWVNDHAAGPLLGSLGESLSIYDVTDDWISFYPKGRMQALVESQDSFLCRNATATIVCSSKLLEMKKQYAANIALIPNGVDLHHYRPASQNYGLPHKKIPWHSPVFGYTGTLHSERVDIQLICDVARQTKGTFVFIGPDMLTSQERSTLTALENIVLLGPKPYSELPEFMKSFDVCIVPHRMSDFTNSLNPIKLWEYLATGKPIVSTDVAGFRDYPRLVRLASDATEFSEALTAALGESGDLAQQRIAIAAKNSWVKRLDDIEHFIAELSA